MVDKQSNDLKKKGGGELWEENKPEKLGEKIHKSHREKLAPADERMQRSDTRLYLPADLVENILIRLPVRQLVRFQIVCKDWRSLLGQSRFIYAHLKNNSHKFLHSRDSSQIWIVENLDQSPLYFKLCDLRGEHIRGISACDGLILCNTYSGKIAIWNLQVRRWLPDREFVSFDDCCCLGRTRDMIYKVLTFNLVASRYYDSALNTLEAEICDLHSQSWKSVEMDDTWTLYRNKFVVLSLGGNSFWLACWCDNNEVFVQSFNFSTESFIPVRLPFVVKPLDETTTALS
ncbi:PREDICTED: F-box/WD-40 repeat-containing protein 1-like, partial [Camelina sativa]